MAELPVTVYTPDSSLARPTTMARDMFRDLLVGRGLAWRLAVRDINAQYRQAFLGMLWAFIMPLANALTWIFLSRSGIVAVSETALLYPVYAFTGTMLWSVLMDAMVTPLGQTNTARGMLAKLNFPREAILLSGLYQILFNTAIKVGLLIAAVLVMGINPGWGLLLFPLGLVSLVLVGTAIGLLITPVGMLYHDIGRAMPLLMQFLMYLTPVVFAVPQAGVGRTLFHLNPLTPIILTARDWLTGMTPAFLGYFLAVNAAAFVLLLAAWIAYRLAMPILIERMSA